MTPCDQWRTLWATRPLSLRVAAAIDALRHGLPKLALYRLAGDGDFAKPRLAPWNDRFPPPVLDPVRAESAVTATAQAVDLLRSGRAATALSTLCPLISAPYKAAAWPPERRSWRRPVSLGTQEGRS